MKDKVTSMIENAEKNGVISREDVNKYRSKPGILIQMIAKRLSKKDATQNNHALQSIANPSPRKNISLSPVIEDMEEHAVVLEVPKLRIGIISGITINAENTTPNRNSELRARKESPSPRRRFLFQDDNRQYQLEGGLQNNKDGLDMKSDGKSTPREHSVDRDEKLSFYKRTLPLLYKQKKKQEEDSQ
jgi:hypothetical protein